MEAGRLSSGALADKEFPLLSYFTSIKPYVEVARAGDHVASVAFFVDDYHADPVNIGRPADTFNRVYEAAGKAGVSIDYIGREEGCLGSVYEALGLLANSCDYLRETTDHTGERTWVVDIRSKRKSGAAASPRAVTRKRHPGETFFDIEVNRYPDPIVQPVASWSCPYMTAMWQGLRLGVLANLDFAKPTVVDDGLFYWESWEQVPPLIRLNSDAAPFAAEQIFSILPASLMPVEFAATKILSRLGPLLPERPFLEKRVSHTFLSGI